MNEKNLGITGKLLVALPLLSLALGALAWLRYGMDIPWFDDWRGYAEGSMHSLSLSHIFRPMNDTMAPIGFVLDALAQRFLDGNSVAYQLLSMLTVLGGILLLQWKLLNKTLGNPAQAALCFAFTVLMLQPDSYWGRENLAYHQCLPLVFILGALWLSVCQDHARWWHGPSIFLLGLLAGFTYISGAFGALTVGCTLLVIARVFFSGPLWKDVARNGAWLSAAGVIGAATQLVRAILPSGATHAGVPLTFPYTGEFWAFLLGKVGRSLLLSPASPGISLAITVLVCMAAVGVAVLLVRRIRGPQVSIEQHRVTAVYIALAAMVFVYLMMVAAGRTRFRPGDMHQLMDIFAYAFTRFHFFWATLLWPWLVAALIVLCQPPMPKERTIVQSAVLLVLVVALPILAYRGGAFSHMKVHRGMAQAREEAGRCLMESLQKEGEIHCSGLIPPRFEIPAPDSYGAYAYAWNTGASFVRNYPILSSAKRSEAIPPFYQMTRLLGVLKIEQLNYLGGNVVEVTGRDSKLFIDTQQPKVMRRCGLMDVEVDMQTQREDTAQVFFMPVGATAYSEVNSRRALLTPSRLPQTVRFRLESPAGFQNPIRIDLVTEPQTIEVKDIRAYCRQRR